MILQSFFLSSILLLSQQQHVTSFVPLSLKQQTSKYSFLNVASNNNPISTTTTLAPSSSSSSKPTLLEVDPNLITKENPLQVLIAGGGIGGLVLASGLVQHDHMNVTILERTDSFQRFGGPIQLASNALEIIRTMNTTIFNQVMEKFTTTGDKRNGIKDGIRSEWYATFDLKTPAERRNMALTGVIERPDLQNIYLNSLPHGVVQNGNAVVNYYTTSNNKVHVELESGDIIQGDVLIGADGIWSTVRNTMRQNNNNNKQQAVATAEKDTTTTTTTTLSSKTTNKANKSGAKYSGYTVYAGELHYDSFDHGEVGYKVYIGPEQYFVITDIGNGRYQWYAFLAQPPGFQVDKPDDDNSLYLQDVFRGWSSEIHHILKATRDDEIQQRDLYDLAPSNDDWIRHANVALMGDAIHAMMPNLGQGGCQAMEDALVLNQELSSLTNRKGLNNVLKNYKNRRLVRSAAVQGLSRFASDIIIQGFDTPAKIISDGGLRFENFNYAGIVTKMLQPILPIFFSIQFNFLYEGWKNEAKIDLKAALGFLIIGGFILFIGVGLVEEAALFGGLGLEAVLGAEGFEAILASLRELLAGGGF